jgi:hypothetical protein
MLQSDKNLFTILDTLAFRFIPIERTHASPISGDESSIPPGLSQQREWNKDGPASVVLNKWKDV